MYNIVGGSKEMYGRIGLGWIVWDMVGLEGRGTCPYDCIQKVGFGRQT